MRLAALTLSSQGALILERLADALPELELYRHQDLQRPQRAQAFPSVCRLSRELFGRCRGLIYVMPCGLVNRAIAPLLEHKLRDPAVVCVDAGGRYAISLLSGHQGGANRLAVQVANILGAEPIITTTSEAVRDLIVGVGCRKGKSAAEIVAAVREGLERSGCRLEQVRLLATAGVKANESGLQQAAVALGLDLRVVEDEEIRASHHYLTCSKFVAEQVNLPAVAEPAALLAARRTSLILPRIALNGVTIAIARENCFSLASVPETD